MQFGYIFFAFLMTFAIFKVIFAGFWMYLFCVVRIGTIEDNLLPLQNQKKLAGHQAVFSSNVTCYFVTCDDKDPKSSMTFENHGFQGGVFIFLFLFFLRENFYVKKSIRTKICKNQTKIKNMNSFLFAFCRFL